MRNKHFPFKRIISIALVFSMLSGMMTGCAKEAVNTSQESNIETASSVDTESIAEAISENIQNEALETSTENVVMPVNITYEWEDYVGDLDAFVYGLLFSEYELCYEVFNARVTLKDGTEVYGLAYTDYAYYMESDDGHGYFPAGFLGLIGEAEIPEDEIETGIVITNIDDDISDYSFVYAYKTDPYLEHCVIWNQYLKYGVDDTGTITYYSTPYIRGDCDETLGALYSYDEARYVFDPNVGEYVPITGNSLYTYVDYAELEAEVNRILEEQDFNFSQEDVTTAVHFAQEAVESYLLSMQEETFMGCSVADLISYAESLDPTELIRYTADGILIIDIDDEPPEEPEALTKWLVGISCGIVVAGSIALDIFVPALRPVSGAMSGAAVEVFMQVVVENQNLNNINWTKVAVSATSGALLAWACPLAAASAAKGVVNAAGQEVVTILGKEIATEALAKLSGYAVLTFSNALVSGITSASFSLIDGNSSEDALNAFLIGAAIGGACTVLASAASEIGNAAMSAFAKSHPNNWLVKATETAATFIGEHQVHLFTESVEEILAPKSVYEATRCAMNELREQTAATEFVINAIKELPADDNPNFVKVDTSGNVMTKTEVLENGGNCVIRPTDGCDPEILKVFEQFDVTEIKVTNGVPDLSPFSEYTFLPTGGISSNRDKNMDEYYTQLANEWISNPESIPEKVKVLLSPEQLENLDDSLVQSVLSEANLTPHEGTDGYVYLVDTFLHSKFSHSGGVALAKAQAAISVAKAWFEELSTSVVTAVSGTLIAEEVN